MFTGILGLPCCQPGRLVPAFLRRCTWEIAGPGAVVIVPARSVIAAVDPDPMEFMVQARRVEAAVATRTTEILPTVKHITTESN